MAGMRQPQQAIRPDAPMPVAQETHLANGGGVPSFIVLIYDEVVARGMGLVHGSGNAHTPTIAPDHHHARALPVYHPKE